MNLKNAGITCEEGDDWVCIHPGKPQACQIETFVLSQSEKTPTSASGE